MITASGSDNAAALLPGLPVTVDAHGRRRVSKVQRREILAALGRSGESVPRFARQTGIKYSTLARWVQMNRSKPSGRQPPLRLLEAVIESPATPGAGTLLVLQLPGGARAEVASQTQAALAARDSILSQLSGE